jgi:hypothetical protein
MDPKTAEKPPSVGISGTLSSSIKTSKEPAAAQGDRLGSWKEIATFLACDERTARRWEELGLPVHRVPGAKRSRVVASRAEISQWLRGRQELESSNAADGTPIPPSAVVATYSPRSPSRKAIYLAGALGGVVVLLGLAIAAIKRSPSQPIPARMSFLADSMRALGSDGRVLWTYQFSGPLDPQRIPAPFKLDDFVRMEDLLADGRREVVVVAPVRTSPNLQHFPRVEVDCFSESGVILWSYVPREMLQFGEREGSGPWLPYDIQVSRRGPPHSIFVVFDQTPWGYSFVEEIDPATGRGTIRFVNTGSIHRLEELHTSRGTYLLVGGFNNEFEGGSLAVFDETRSFAASPQTPGTRHACANCPPGNPDYYFVFPRSELNRLRQVYETPVVGLNVNGDQFEVDKLEVIPRTDVSMGYLFQTEPTLRLLSLHYDSRYEMLHRELEQKGELDHPLAKCPERLHPAPVRVWTPSDGWKEWDVKPVAP